MYVHECYHPELCLLFLDSDRLLLHTAVKAMEKAGWPTDILTGRTMFHLGQNERNAQSSARERL